MPLVFVHGVNVREGELYSRERAFRDRHFVEIFYRQLGRQVPVESILNPYWGDLGASLSPDTPFLPRGGYDMLWRRNLEADPDTTVSDIEDIFDSDCATPLLEMARTASLADVVDLLWDIVDQEMNEGGPGCEKSAEDMARLAQRALDFAHSPEGDAWLKTVKTDEELLERLGGLLHEDGNQTNPAPAATKSNKTTISGMVKSAGGRFQKRITDARHHLKNRSKSLRVRLREDMANVRLRIRQKAVGTTARLINNPIRAIFHQQCALLIGDAFSYFSARGDDKPSPIAQRVIDALQEAVAIRDKTGEEVIVIGHSMGGVILCDIVTHYGKDIPIDVLITVGSQFPLFADLKMFPGVDPADRPVPRPDNVKRWINIFDPHDFLGYPGSHIFEGIDDFHLPTYAVGGAAHTDYFNRPSFYWQLARRLMDYVPVRA
jgi:hypothetical protein